MAVLAVTVLAASGGGRADDGPALHDRAYYPPLRRLLGLSPGAQPGGFDNDVAMLWEYLREWLDDDLGGTRGRSSASATKHLPNVGWALSQTLLRPAERAHLADFFRAIGAEPGEDVDAAVLLACYRRWWSRRHREPVRPAAMQRGSGAAETLGTILRQSLLAWDGRSRDERGRITLPLQLAYYSGEGLLHLASRTPAGLEGRLLVVDGREVTLGTTDEWLLVPVDPAEALSGTPVEGRLAGDGADPRPPLRMRLHTADVHVLASNTELAMWVEVPAASFGQEHVIVVREAAAAAAEKAMADLGGQPLRLTRVRLPAGWRAYRRFEPTRAAPVDGNLTGLLPSASQLARLSGGLPIDLRSRVWLTIGPPDVTLPDLDGQELPAVRLDGTDLSWPSTGHLRLYGKALSAGTHEVAVAGRVLRFALVDEAVDQDGHGDVRLTVDRQPVRHRFTVRPEPYEDDSAETPLSGTPVEVSICGARVSADADGERQLALRPRTHIQIGGSYYALGQPGEAARLQPVTPAWLDHLGAPVYPRDADLAGALAGLPFAPQWLLHVPKMGRPTIANLSDVVPADATGADLRPDSGPGAWTRAAKSLDLAEASGDEKAAWESWLARSHDRAALVGSMRPLMPGER